MFFTTLLLAHKLGFGYSVQSVTAASKDFEIAIAVAATFGPESDEVYGRAGAVGVGVCC